MMVMSISRCRFSGPSQGSELFSNSFMFVFLWIHFLVSSYSLFLQCIAILQVIPAISISGGKPTILLPLVFVLVVSAVKDAIEDWKRAKADKSENQRVYLRLVQHHQDGQAHGDSSNPSSSSSLSSSSSPSSVVSSVSDRHATFEPVACQDLRVGDIVKITDEQSFPADLYLLYSSLEQQSLDERVSSGSVVGGASRRATRAASSAQTPQQASASSSVTSPPPPSNSTLKRTSMKRASALLRSTRDLNDRASSSSSSSNYHSTNPSQYGGSYAYVETSNLDGESALRLKFASELTRDLCDEYMLAHHAHFELRVEPPNGKLDKFGGMVARHMSTGTGAGAGMGTEEDEFTIINSKGQSSQEQILTLDHLLLRGSRLRNTGFIYGLVLYTGEESKIRQNSRDRANARIKRSSIERLMNQQIYIMFALQVCFCFVGGLLAGIWQDSHSAHASYLGVTTSPAVTGLQRFFTWFIIFSGFVPISLLVSLEVVKFAQGVFIGWDIGMCHYIPTPIGGAKLATTATADATAMTTNKQSRTRQVSAKSITSQADRQLDESKKTKSKKDGKQSLTTDILKSDDTSEPMPLASLASSSSSKTKPSFPGELQFARAQTSGLNEELGRIGWLCSDKTGTLTENSMDFRKAVIGAIEYGTGTTEMMTAILAQRARQQQQHHQQQPPQQQSVASPRDADSDPSGAIEVEVEIRPAQVVPLAGAPLAPTPTPVSPSQSLATKYNLPRRSAHVQFDAASREQILAALQASGSGGGGASPSVESASVHQARVHAYFMNLALCNSVFPTLDNYNSVIYKASSPDEEALVEFARHCGYELSERVPPFVAVRLQGPAMTMATTEQQTSSSSSSSTATSPSSSASATFKDVEFEQLALLEFTSKRKRMSVIVRDARSGRIHVHCKGADMTLLPLLSRPYAGDVTRIPNWSRTSDALTQFSDEGLRTLIVASATLDPAWWDDPVHGWAQRYARRMKELAVEGPHEEGHAKGSCHAACRRCELEEEIETSANLQLLGGTAIEDKLQREVPATIKALLDAGIKVWVLTGDKLNTAVNIGMACQLLESSMERDGNLLTIDGDNIELVAEQVERAYQHVRRLVARERNGVPDVDVALESEHGHGRGGKKLDYTRPTPPPTPLSKPIGLVLESHAFIAIMNSVGDAYTGSARTHTRTRAHPLSSSLVRKFLYVAVHAKSVVACRCQPSTKSTIVSLIKETQHVPTLAIGDGANDEPMIRAASVGVGIRGVEGTTAVQAADYSISQFSFIRRLLFVHGRLSLRRVSILISYIFYKTSLMCFAVFWFGIFSGFSGQNLVMEWAYQLYNVLFTSLPILIFAVFDRDIHPEVLEQHPDIYRLSSSARGAWLNTRIFWTKWMTLSFVHSLIIFFLPYSLYYYSVSVESGGQSQGMWELGVLIYTSVVLITNLRLALLFRSWSWLHHMALWGSILVYFGVMLIFNLSSVFGTAGGDYYGSIERLFRTGSFWVTLLITVATALYFDIVIEAWDRFKENRHQAQRYNILRRQLPSQESSDDDTDADANVVDDTDTDTDTGAVSVPPTLRVRPHARDGDDGGKSAGVEMQSIQPYVGVGAGSLTGTMNTVNIDEDIDALQVTPIPLIQPANSSTLLHNTTVSSIPRFNSTMISSSSSVATVDARPSSPSFTSVTSSLQFAPPIAHQHELISPILKASSTSLNTPSLTTPHHRPLTDVSSLTFAQALSSPRSPSHGDLMSDDVSGTTEDWGQPLATLDPLPIKTGLAFTNSTHEDASSPAAIRRAQVRQREIEMMSRVQWIIMAVR